MNEAALKQIKKWLSLRKVNRKIRCPFSAAILNESGSKSAVAERNGNDQTRRDLCIEVVGAKYGGKACGSSLGGVCPCGRLGVDVVSRRARLYVKTH